MARAALTQCRWCELKACVRGNGRRAQDAGVEGRKGPCYTDRHCKDKGQSADINNTRRQPGLDL